MVSYADFMTLLFAFFVVLYSSSQVDRAKMASLSNAITAGFSSLGVGAGQGGAPIIIPGVTPAGSIHPPHPEESAKFVLRKLEIDLAEELTRRNVSLRETPEGIVLACAKVRFFDSGSATLRASSVNTFDGLRLRARFNGSQRPRRGTH